MAKSTKSRSEKLRELRLLPRIDPWAVLGLEKSASDADIKKSYRRLAREHHPDKNRGREAESAAKFKEVVAAYEVLSDPEKRELFEGMRWEDAPLPEPVDDYAPSPYSPPRRRRPWNRHVKNIDGVPHYHAGNVQFCVSCGLGVSPESLNRTVTAPPKREEGSGSLPGGAFCFVGVK